MAREWALQLQLPDGRTVISDHTEDIGLANVWLARLNSQTTIVTREVPEWTPWTP